MVRSDGHINRKVFSFGQIRFEWACFCLLNNIMKSTRRILLLIKSLLIYFYVFFHIIEVKLLIVCGSRLGWNIAVRSLYIRYTKLHLTSKVLLLRQDMLGLGGWLIATIYICMCCELFHAVQLRNVRLIWYKSTLK